MRISCEAEQEGKIGDLLWALLFVSSMLSNDRMEENLSDSQLFSLLTQQDITRVIGSISAVQLKVVLPLLVRMGFCPQPQIFSASSTASTGLKAFLLDCPRVNWIMRLLKVDFASLQATLSKELETRKKIFSADGKLGKLSRFEKTIDPSEKFQILFGDLLSSEATVGSSQWPRKCELIDNLAYFDDVGDLLCVGIAEMPCFMGIQELIEVLVRYRNGGLFVRKILMNFPDQTISVVRSLIESSTTDEDMNHHRLSVIATICSLNPLVALEALDITTSQMKMPELFLYLSTEYLSAEEFISVLSGVLFSDDVSKKQWILHCLNGYQKKSVHRKDLCVFTNLKRKLFEGLGQLIGERDKSPGRLLTDKSASNAGQLIHLICFLKIFVNNFKFSDEENEAVLDLMCSLVEPSAVTGEFVKLSIAALVACPQLAMNTDADNKIVDWVRWLLSQESHFERNVRSGNFAELLLLIVIHLLSNQTQPLTLLISSELNIKVSVLKANPLNHLKNLLTADVFTEEVVAERAALVPVTESLSSSHTGYLPIHCVQQLLKNKIFIKHRININEWIFKQLANCAIPIHSAIPALLDSFSASCVMPATVSVAGKPNVSQPIHMPLDEHQMMAAFNGNIFDETRIVSRILLFYYALVFDENLTLKHGPGALPNKPHGYSKELWDAIPVRFLTDLVQTCIVDYAPIASNLLRMATSKFPHLFTVMTAWPNLYVPLKRTSVRPVSFSSLDLQKEMELSGQRPSNAILYLQSLVEAPFEVKIDFVEVVTSSLPLLLDDLVPRQLLNDTLKFWLQLETLHPRWLYKLTLSSLVHRDVIAASVNVSKDELDPLLVLRCDERVFRCGPILEIVLRILTSYLVESKMQLQQICAVHSEGASEAEKEELMRALVGAQESAAVQILLEACLPATSPDAPLEEVMCAKETECIVFNYIHQAFINDPTLIKLVHFQGYPSRLLPHTVAGIPSMHCCIDFIPEMLRQADHSKQIFAINLAAHLCVQYPIAKAFSCAKLVVDFLNTVLCAMTFDDLYRFFAQILSSCALISQVFPPLTSDICAILLQFARMLWSSISILGQSFTDLREQLRRNSTTSLIPSSVAEKVMLLDRLTNLLGEEFSQSVISQSNLCQSAAMSVV